MNSEIPCRWSQTCSQKSNMKFEDGFFAHSDSLCLLHAGNVEASCSEKEVGRGQDAIQPFQHFVPVQSWREYFLFKLIFFKAADSRAQKTQQLFENTRHFSKNCHNPTRLNLSGAAGCIREALGSLRSAVSGNFCKQYATDVPFTPLALVSHSSLQ